jgi:hypothetical protein
MESPEAREIEAIGRAIIDLVIGLIKKMRGAIETIEEDLNNPITGIRGSAGLTDKYLKRLVSERESSSLCRMVRNATRYAHISNALKKPWELLGEMIEVGSNLLASATGQTIFV